MMRLLFEGAVFMLAAIVAHLALWTPDARDGAPEGGGAGGEQLLSVKPASSRVASMVEDWERPPEIARSVKTEVAMPETAPSPSLQMPRRAEAAARSAPRTAPAPRMTPAAEAPALPSYEKPLPPEPGPAPVAKVRPKLKPQNLAEQPPQTAQERAKAKKPPKKKVAERPRQQASKAAQGAQKRVAKGAGQGAASGNDKKAKSAALSQSQRASLLRQWGGQIRDRIARRAPRGAGRGTAILTITVSGSGALVGVSLAKSSGNDRIDRLALASVRQAGRFPAAPSKLGVGQHAFRLPIRSR